MSEETGGERSIVSAKAAASANLRETAKWLVGGVAATSAGVFAGSSLTRLGSLDIDHYPIRLLMAIGGGLFGFVGLAMILVKAVAVLTSESVNLPGLAAGGTRALAAVRDRMDVVYAIAFPGKVGSVAALQARATEVHERQKEAEKTHAQQSDEDKAFLADFKAFYPRLMAEAGFQHVSWKFARLITAIWIGGPLAIIGFGLFAWAANPPEDKPPSAKPTITVINNR